MVKMRLLAVSCFSMPAVAAGLPAYPFIHATGTAYSFVRPDLGMPNLDAFAVTFGVTGRVRLEEELVGEAVKDAPRRPHGARWPAYQLKYLGNSVGLVPSVRYNRASSRERQNPQDMLMVSAIKMTQTVDALFRIK